MVAEGDFSTNSVVDNLSINRFSSRFFTLKSLGGTLSYQFTVTHTGLGSLVLFDIQGRMVKKMMQGHLIGGNLYKGQLDSKSLRSGRYCAILKSGEGISNKDTVYCALIFIYLSYLVRTHRVASMLTVSPDADVSVCTGATCVMRSHISP